MRNKIAVVVVGILVWCLPVWGQAESGWNCHESQWDKYCVWFGEGAITSLDSTTLWNIGAPPVQQNSPLLYTWDEIHELQFAYRSVIAGLEAELKEHDSTIRSLQVQLSAHRDYQVALEENHKVMKELAGHGKKKSKLDWVWFGVKTGGTLFTACELTSIC